MNAIKTRIIKIGNSQGIRIPKLLLDQVDFGEDVDLELKGNRIIIRASHAPRHDWGEQFQEMAIQGDDQLLDEAIIQTDWDENNWQW